MKIKVAFVDSDSTYIERIKAKFRKDYSEEIEASYYSSVENLVNNFDKNRVDIAVINSSFTGNSAFYHVKCPILVLSEAGERGTVDDHPVIAKYQRIEEIYRSIMLLYSENAETMGGFIPVSEGGKQIIAFATPAGGSGSSTMAIACAEHLARSGRRVLYLNLEEIAYYYYTGNNGGFEDLIITAKDNRGNLSLKIESIARTTTTGVTYLPGIKNALDMASLDQESIETLIDAVKRINNIDYIVIDADFALDEKTYSILNKSSIIIMTTDGSEIANSKLNMGLIALGILEGRYQFMNKIYIIYNKFSAGSFATKLTGDYKEAGTVGRYKAATADIIKAVSELPIFDVIE